MNRYVLGFALDNNLWRRARLSITGGWRVPNRNVSFRTFPPVLRLLFVEHLLERVAVVVVQVQDECLTNAFFRLWLTPAASTVVHQRTFEPALRVALWFRQHRGQRLLKFHG